MPKINNFFLNLHSFKKKTFAEKEQILTGESICEEPSYVATRTSICAGTLMMTHPDSFIEVKCFDENKDSKTEEFNLNYHATLQNLRGMLFNVNEKGLANDLIYTTPTNYLIDGIKPKVYVMTKFFIYNCVNLDEFLKYKDFGIYLTQDNLDEIYREFIVSDLWLRNHMELFGFKKKKDGSYSTFKGYYSYDMYSKLVECSWGSSSPDILEPGYKLINKR